MQILNLAVIHKPSYPWQYVEGNYCYLRVKTCLPVQAITVWYGDPFWFSGPEKKPQLSCREMLPTQRMPDSQLYAVSIRMQTHKLHYYFVIKLQTGMCVWLSECGVTLPIKEPGALRYFNVPYVFPQAHSLAPAWASSFTWYQIFPDRFCNEKNNHDAKIFVPTRDNFYGGTLNGILQKIPYLQTLGIQGIYLNPIFGSCSNHRYDTTSYDYIEPALGNETVFGTLVETLHKAGMKIMLDGVFNHCGWNNIIWQDVKRYGNASIYRDWFIVYDADALTTLQPEALSSERMQNKPPYECFAFAANMPKWNTENPEVIDYLISRAERWTNEYQIDAWRLDVPDETSLRFLHSFANRLRKLNPNVYIIGEIWQDPAEWLDQHVFDATMDYPLYFAIRDFALLHTDSLEVFSMRIQRWFESMPDLIHKRQWAFCSNHDIPRAWHLCGGRTSDFQLAYLLAALLGGGLSVYYGDEIALDGGTDPDNRRAMQWTAQWTDIGMFIRKLLSLKQTAFAESRLAEIVLDTYLYLRLETQSTEVIAIITEPGQTVMIPEIRTLNILIECVDGQALQGQVTGFAVFQKAKGLVIGHA